MVPEHTKNKKRKADPSSGVTAAEFAAFKEETERQFAQVLKSSEKSNSSHAGGSDAAGSN